MDKKYFILPYIKVDGIPTLRDSEIMELYDRLVEDGLDRVMFFMEPMMTRELFLEGVKSNGTLFYAIEDEDGSIAAIAYINRFEGKTARYHTCVYKKWWGVGGSKISLLMADHIKGLRDENGMPIFVRLIGYLPSIYEHTLNAALREGVSIVGCIPDYFWDYQTNKSVDATILYY